MALGVMLAIAAAGVVLAYWKVRLETGEVSSEPPPGAAYPYTVVEALDGTTARLSDGTIVRYIGVVPDERFASDLHTFHRDLVVGRQVRIERDRTERDEEGRALVYLFLRLDGGGEVFANARLLETGMAYATGERRNTKYFLKLLRVQRQARAKGLGVWRCIAPRDTPLVGSHVTYRFHLPECELVKKDSEEFYRVDSKNAAFDQGLAPCARCRP